MNDPYRMHYVQVVPAKSKSSFRCRETLFPHLQSFQCGHTVRPHRPIFHHPCSPYIGNPLYVIGYCDLMLESNLGGVVPIPASRPSLSPEELPININEGRHSVEGPQHPEGEGGGSTAIGEDEGGRVAVGVEGVTASAGQASTVTVATPERLEKVEGLLPGVFTPEENGEHLPKSPNRTLFRYVRGIRSNG